MTYPSIWYPTWSQKAQGNLTQASFPRSPGPGVLLRFSLQPCFCSHPNICPAQLQSPGADSVKPLGPQTW